MCGTSLCEDIVGGALLFIGILILLSPIIIPLFSSANDLRRLRTKRDLRDYEAALRLKMYQDIERVANKVDKVD